MCTIISGLSNSLVYLVAVVIGSPMKRTHLWFHLFEPNALENSYMTGFIVSLTTFYTKRVVEICNSYIVHGNNVGIYVVNSQLKYIGYIDTFLSNYSSLKLVN